MKLTITAIVPSTTCPACTTAMMMTSLDQNPLNGGTPAMLNEAIRQQLEVTGMSFASPPSSLSCRVPVAYSIAPLVRKRSDLNAAWFIMWKSPPKTASDATATGP